MFGLIMNLLIFPRIWDSYVWVIARNFIGFIYFDNINIKFHYAKTAQHSLLS